MIARVLDLPLANDLGLKFVAGLAPGQEGSQGPGLLVVEGGALHEPAGDQDLVADHQSDLEALHGEGDRVHDQEKGDVPEQGHLFDGDALAPGQSQGLGGPVLHQSPIAGAGAHILAAAEAVLVTNEKRGTERRAGLCLHPHL